MRRKLNAKSHASSVKNGNLPYRGRIIRKANGNIILG
jgi:hypothetical protein